MKILWYKPYTKVCFSISGLLFQSIQIMTDSITLSLKSFHKSLHVYTVYPFTPVFVFLFSLHFYLMLCPFPPSLRLPLVSLRWECSCGTQWNPAVCVYLSTCLGDYGLLPKMPVQLGVDFTMLSHGAGECYHWLKLGPAGSSSTIFTFHFFVNAFSNLIWHHLELNSRAQNTAWQFHSLVFGLLQSSFCPPKNFYSMFYYFLCKHSTR